MANDNRISRNPIGRIEKVSGTFFVMAFAILILPFVAGCGDDCSECPGPAVTYAPPYPPDGVFSVTGDEKVTIYWNDKTDPNIIQYGIFRHTEATGRYVRIATVDWEDACVDGLCSYEDTDVQNGETWYYGVTSIDDKGRESEDLSYEVVHDTPRPEGSGLVLMDLGQTPASSGYDFSEFSVQAWDSITTDIYFGAADGVYYIFTSTGVDIQDYGYIDLMWVDWAPENENGLTGWANSGRAEAILGHSYVIVIRNGFDWNVAKIEVTDLVIGPDTKVTLKWAYQEVKNWPELAPAQTTGGAMQ